MAALHRTLLMALIALPGQSHADPAGDEARRQAMMADMRTSAATNDRASFDSQQRRQADAARFSGSGSAAGTASSSSSGGSSASYAGGGSGPARSTGPQSVVATYNFTMRVQETPVQLAARLQAEAGSGNALSAYNLGRVYYTGFDGLPRDDARARRWFGEAARLGHPGAQSQFGYMLHDGIGGAVDAAAAQQWVGRAADQGDDYGEALAGFYAVAADGGRGGPLDTAIGQLTRAADKGQLIAQATLGTLVYALGVGAAQDSGKSAHYIALAAAQGHAGSMVQLARLLLTGHGIAQDNAAGVNWLRQAVAKGDGDAMALLGQLAFTGQGMAQDNAAGAAWFKRAADAGNAKAAGQWAQLLLGGDYGVAKDEAAGARYARLSADKGDINGQMTLARCYDNGNGVAVDMRQALFWFRKAAAQGDAGAAEALRDPRMVEAARAK